MEVTEAVVNIRDFTNDEMEGIYNHLRSIIDDFHFDENELADGIREAASMMEPETQQWLQQLDIEQMEKACLLFGVCTSAAMLLRSADTNDAFSPNDLVDMVFHACRLPDVAFGDEQLLDFAAQALMIILAEPADDFPSLDPGVYQEVQKVLSGWRLKH